MTITLTDENTSFVMSWGLSWPGMEGRKLQRSVTSVSTRMTFRGFTKYTSTVTGSDETNTYK
jgi:hypothetical protein